MLLHILNVDIRRQRRYMRQCRVLLPHTEMGINDHKSTRTNA